MILEKIEGAFALRERPSTVVDIRRPADSDLEDALYFDGRDWHNTSADEWSEYACAIFAFTPEAFCYFLPGIFWAGVRERRPDLMVNDSLIRMLDRSPAIAYWDEFFANRWTLLSDRECECVQEWLLWLSSSKCDIAEDSLVRAYETVQILIRERTAFLKFKGIATSGSGLE